MLEKYLKTLLLEKFDFGKVQFWEVGILGKWDIVKVGFGVNGIGIKRDFGKVVKVEFWGKGILRKWDVGKLGFWEIVIMGLGKIGLAYYGK